MSNKSGMNVVSGQWSMHPSSIRRKIISFPITTSTQIKWIAIIWLLLMRFYAADFKFNLHLFRLICTRNWFLFSPFFSLSLSPSHFACQHLFWLNEAAGQQSHGKWKFKGNKCNPNIQINLGNARCWMLRYEVCFCLFLLSTFD